jgi:hypothetical protein
MSQGLKWVLVAEALLIALAGLLTSYFQRGDLALSWIALVLGIHFVPLAWLFGVDVYYVTGMAVIAWGSCAYLAWNGDRIGSMRAHIEATRQAAQHAAAPVGRGGSMSGRG